jgi:DNA-binding LacI/PurR family transcriptional regulator
VAIQRTGPSTGPSTRPPRRPTLDEVAARAGVGRGTVSRVVNGSSQVSSSARAAVEQAIRELGYVPNRAARALATQRTDSVALVVSESEQRRFEAPFLAGIIRGVNSMLMQTPLHLWLAMAQARPEQERVERHLTPQHVDGVLLLSLDGDDPLATLGNRRGLPVVVCGTGVAAAIVSDAIVSDAIARDAIVSDQVIWVDADDAGGAEAAVAHLVERGRRRVTAIAGPQDIGAAVGRLAGYRRALQAATVPVDESRIDYGDFTEAAGASAMRALLDRHPDLDAVFAASDPMAAGAMRVLREYGRAVPHDVAVVGFEDSVTGTDPALTTVHVPVEPMGREMARLLVAYIRGESVPARRVVLDTHLVVRSST